MMEVYVCDDVRAVERLHPYLHDTGYRALSIHDQLERQASTVHKAVRTGDTAAAVHLRSWWPGAASLSDAEILAKRPSLDDARLTIAREHGFADWDAVEALGEQTTDPVFEAAADAVVTGDLDTLAAGLDAEPALAAARSRFGHRASLLHYIGANGVETWRQKTPLNAVEVARLLLERGADPAAEAEMYGGGQTALALVSTSAHPHEAGVADALAAVLKAAQVLEA